MGGSTLRTQLTLAIICLAGIGCATLQAGQGNFAAAALALAAAFTFSFILLTKTNTETAFALSLWATGAIIAIIAAIALDNNDVDGMMRALLVLAAFIPAVVPKGWGTTWIYNYLLLTIGLALMAALVFLPLQNSADWWFGLAVAPIAVAVSNIRHHELD